MHVFIDNRMLMQIENSKQNSWVLLQMGGGCLNKAYSSFVYFWILVFQLGQIELEIAVW